ncbi:MAG: hypothetical protein QOE70_4744 [Chthoniobacter sp.]|jgi:predicted acylesterase/phospholipase RssA/molybdopterin/thiamine biosynthesis adenylyltransferase/proteasome lid subunit RPN8/RPN11|nr:hypothetical protein [Chthoniobacter sp.]
MTGGQELALEQLRQISAADPYAVEIIDVQPPEAQGGSLRVTLSLHCGRLERAADGLDIRERERFLLRVPPHFPEQKPEVEATHERFAGHPHVFWKRYLCLYQAPETEWNPADGTFGFIDRLWLWMEKGALNQLDPAGAPLHPPLARPQNGPRRYVVPRVDTPVVANDHWIGFAKIEKTDERRVNVVGWSLLADLDEHRPVGAALLLSSPMPYEFPGKVADLVKALTERGVSLDRALFALGAAAFLNPEDQPLYVFVGTPMRGIQGGETRQHLTAWYINPTLTTGLRIALEQYSENGRLREIGEQARAIVLEWIEAAEVAWCWVLEDRPEVTIRRDHAAPIAAFRDKCVAVWGCGALGAHAAIFLARAGVRKLVLKDKSVVTPGILARQPYDEADIGSAKVLALRDKLVRIRPGLPVETEVGNLVESLADDDEWLGDADVVLDCTASLAVQRCIERVRARQGSTVPICSMIINQSAERGLVVIAGAQFSGGAMDVFRKAKIAACRDDAYRDFTATFYPNQEANAVFQPEPGCSDATFVGSSADVAALAASMLNHAARAVFALAEQACARFITAPHAIARPELAASFAGFDFTADVICQDGLGGYEVRISPRALRGMRAWISRSARMSGREDETGGLLFGQRDDGLRILWVDEVTGPPPDSQGSPDLFLCGVVGTQAAHERKRATSRGALGYVGMWHTHPESLPVPSEVDFGGMHRILQAEQFSATRHLLLIVGLPWKKPLLGAYVFERTHFTQRRIRVNATLRPTALHEDRASKIGLALSGGGSRAIAFHLGCLRALHDRGLLSRLEVISAVSGGAVIAAMYGYSQDSFENFDARVVPLLRRGLHGTIARRLLFSRRLPQSLMANIVARSAAYAARIFRKPPPWRRWASRTDAFADVLAAQLFGDDHLSAPRRDDLHLVLNATELRTGTAFRFGSKESGTWRYGSVPGNAIKIAEAVAASAAYPAFLPALDRVFPFEKKGVTEPRRVVLTDGGVYDNLGITCMEPGRDAGFSTNVFSPDYIISCSAGHGQFGDEKIPFGLITRIMRSMDVTFRRVQDTAMSRLHQHRSAGTLRGFALPYLGQIDERLPLIPPDLVPREEVLRYPTNFAAMPAKDLDNLTRRGEQLTHLLLEEYCADL